MKRLFSYILLLTLGTSCTYDYFEDETNYKLFIPQIREKSISDFNVVVFDKSGDKVLEKKYTYPFDWDMFVEQGIVRVKLLPGEYRLSCFANSDDTKSKVEYHKSNKIMDSKIWLESLASSSFHPAPELRTILDREIAVPFIGQPIKVDTLDISKETIYTGKITYRFKNLPESVDQIEIETFNLSTGLSLDGFACNLFDDDCVKQIIQRNSLIVESGMLSVSRNYFPSLYSDDLSTHKKIGVRTRFFDGKGRLVGEYLNKLPDAKDENGNLTDPVLLSKDKLWITFDGFVVVDVSLTEWGDIVNGGITPM